jgi:AcrR family transcriptional regulator
MTETQLHETKNKILHIARVIFAAKGFEGASIRQIASEAGVNIAAVNYHFTSKEKLFEQVIDLVFSETSQNIRTRRLDNPSEKVDDLAVWIFGYFLDKADILRSVFQMMLSEKGWGPENECVDNDEKFGPPGGLALAEAISLELDHEVNEADMYWAVKMIFSNVVHLALMYSNHFCKMPREEQKYHTQQELENDIRRLVGVVLKDL